MADTEVVGSVASEDGVNWTLHLGNAATGLKGKTKYKVRPVGAELEVTTLEALAPPEFVTKPEIVSASSLPGATLGGNNGTWKGNPMPTLKRIFWLKNGTASANIIPNQNGGTLSTASGFVAGDFIVRGVEIESTINGQAVTVTEYSLPFLLTALQSMTPVVTPDPLIAGQAFSIDFGVSLAANEVTCSVPLTGTGQIREGMAPADDTITVSVGAKKSGYEEFLKSYEVDPAPASLTVAPQEIFRVDLTKPETLTFTDPSRYAKSYVVDPAVSGPQILGDVVLRTVSGNAAKVGEEAIVDVGPVSSLYPDAPALDISLFAGAEERTITGNRYTPVAADAGKTLSAKVIAVDASGPSAEITSNSLAIPAAGIPVGVTPVGGFTAARQGGTAHSINIDLGEADPAKVVYVAWTDFGAYIQSSTFMISAGGVDYPLTFIRSASTGNSHSLQFAYAAIPVGGAAVLKSTLSNNGGINMGAYVWATKGMTRVANASLGTTFTAGTPISWTLNTQVNDEVLIPAVHTVPDAANGVFGSPVNLVELADFKHPDNTSGQVLQMAAFGGRETAATTGRVFSFTPSVSGQGAALGLHLRRA